MNQMPWQKKNSRICRWRSLSSMKPIQSLYSAWSNYGGVSYKGHLKGGFGFDNNLVHDEFSCSLRRPGLLWFECMYVCMYPAHIDIYLYKYVCVLFFSSWRVKDWPWHERPRWFAMHYEWRWRDGKDTKELKESTPQQSQKTGLASVSDFVSTVAMFMLTHLPSFNLREEGS